MVFQRLGGGGEWHKYGGMGHRTVSTHEPTGKGNKHIRRGNGTRTGGDGLGPGGTRTGPVVVWDGGRFPRERGDGTGKAQVRGAGGPGRYRYQGAEVDERTRCRSRPGLWSSGGPKGGTAGAQRGFLGGRSDQAGTAHIGCRPPPGRSEGGARIQGLLSTSSAPRFQARRGRGGTHRGGDTLSRPRPRDRGDRGPNARQQPGLRAWDEPGGGDIKVWAVWRPRATTSARNKPGRGKAGAAVKSSRETSLHSTSGRVIL